jgi:hypothetical protein
VTETLELLQQATNLLAVVSCADRSLFSDDDLCALLAAEEAAGRLIDGARAQTAAEVDERSRCELGSGGLSMKHGHRKAVHFIEQVTRVSQAEVCRRIRLGSAIRSRTTFDGAMRAAAHPSVASAVADGSIGVEAAATIVRCLAQASRGSDASPDRLDAAEASLVATAQNSSADLVAGVARLWREALDPDGAEPRHEEILQRRGLTLGRERNGISDIHIKADAQTRALVQAALADSTVPGAVPRFMSEEDRIRGTEFIKVGSDEIEVTTDTRTREQKQFDIFVGVFLAGVRATHSDDASVRTTGSVTAVVTLRELADGVGIGWLDGVLEPIPASVVREMVCDAGLRLTVLGDAGEPLYQGRRERLFTAAQRRALSVRDGGCVGPGCTAPPSWCHAHHAIPWFEGGLTNVDNGVLLCSAHHHALHSGAFDIEIRDGRPWLRLHSYLEGAGDWRAVGRSRVRGAVAA